MKGFNDLPEEMITEVFKRLPLKSRFGDNKISRVCTAWRHYLELNKGKFSKPTKIQLDAECKTPDDAIAYLSDPHIVEFLPYNEVLRIANLNRSIYKELPQELIPEYRKTVGQYSSETAIDFYNACLEDQRVFNNEMNALLDMAGNHVDLAELMTKNLNVMNDAEDFQRGKLGYHLSIFKKVPGVRSGAPRPKSEQEALEFIRDFQPYYTLRNENVFTGIAHFEKAVHLFLDKRDLHARLDGDDLVDLAKNHYSVIKRIFADPLFFDKLSLKQKATLAVVDTTLVKQCFNSAEFRQRNQRCLGLLFLKNQPRVVSWILSDKQVWTLLDEYEREEMLPYKELFSIQDIQALCDDEHAANVEIHIACCKALLKNTNNTSAASYLKDLLDVKALLKSNEGMNLLGHILKEPLLCQYLSSERLSEMMLGSKVLGRYILERPVVFNKLNNWDKEDIISHCFEYAKEILTYYPQDFPDFQFARVYHFCKKFPMLYEAYPQVKTKMEKYFADRKLEIAQKLRLLQEIQAIATSLSERPNSITRLK